MRTSPTWRRRQALRCATNAGPGLGPRTVRGAHGVGRAWAGSSLRGCTQFRNTHCAALHCRMPSSSRLTWALAGRPPRARVGSAAAPFCPSWAPSAARLRCCAHRASVSLTRNSSRFPLPLPAPGAGSATGGMMEGIKGAAQVGGQPLAAGCLVMCPGQGNPAHGLGAIGMHSSGQLALCSPVEPAETAQPPPAASTLHHWCEAKCRPCRPTRCREPLTL